jgi:hypothetical protein
MIVEMYLFPPEHGDSLKGLLRTRLKDKVAAGKEWDAARERAWAWGTGLGLKPGMTTGPGEPSQA